MSELNDTSDNFYASLMAKLAEAQSIRAESDAKIAAMKAETAAKIAAADAQREEMAAKLAATLKANDERFAESLTQFNERFNANCERLVAHVNEKRNSQNGITDIPLQEPSPATVQPDPAENLVNEAKEVNIMKSAQTDKTEPTAELTSGVKKATSSYVEQSVIALTAEPTGHASGYVKSIETSEPTSVADNAAS